VVLAALEQTEPLPSAADTTSKQPIPPSIEYLQRHLRVAFFF